MLGNEDLPQLINNKFNKLVNNGDSIGIEMPLPNDVEDRIMGWGLYYESFSQTYTPAPYIRDRAGNGQLDKAWRCNYVENKDGTTITAFCLNLLPKESSSNGSLHRYEPGESIDLKAWSFIGEGPTQFYSLSGGNNVF